MFDISQIPTLLEYNLNNKGETSFLLCEHANC